MLKFLRVAAITPEIRVADCAGNAGRIISAIRRADSENIRLICMPELCVTGYTCGDLFLQKPLLDGARAALSRIVAETSGCKVLCVAGLPLEAGGKIYNVAAVFCGGEMLGFVPKTYLPNYGEFYELRHFAPAAGNAVEMHRPAARRLEAGFQECGRKIFFSEKEIPFGANLIFECAELPEFKLAVEICEDLWAAFPPSANHAAAGATVIANLSASSETIGKADFRRSLAAGQSARLICGYLYADAGYGESTSDMVFSAHNLICENGAVLAESPPFGDGFAVSEIDLHALAFDRRRLNTFPAASATHETVRFSLDARAATLLRKIPATPFVPENIAARCEDILAIQTHGLARRLEHTNARAVLGISGGLDSTLALLVTVRAYEFLGRERGEILAVTMPCFGTTARTKSNAHRLCAALGVDCREIDIIETVRRHLRDISHDEAARDATFENAQARIRTLVLMDLANQNGGIVVGSGNLSELALGWATYNGDHMSMYGVNAGVPKTLVRHIVRHAADSRRELAAVLADILETPVSPELLPPENGEIAQKTEDILGSYELHDFFLYHALRHGREPAQILELACIAFGTNGNAKYPREKIEARLKLFFTRFHSQQFKRNCLPDGPKIGSVALSPRGDWRMPSDTEWTGK